ncbi:MAG: flagellar hook-associated protein FlgK [Sneathiella sp.]|jgi:flagellar hook-associated protein 1 FlgK|uniref:flagellar hook-associated protein FlgK n=1 Tax=Sneathiella sp. TaxID=1964365 RepID=UPI000C437F79|nr:flagellar hook-associated protein FlgK [Sneathiella sp.]MAL77633.1 flagellar hook-associated protein FlgK [Sneathiella sp.]
MSLNAIMNSGISAMLTNQSALNVTSSNIANVNTDGYARKTVDFSAVSINGFGSGVEIAEVRRITDEYIAKELRLATAGSEQYKAMSKLYDQLQSLLGDPAANSSLTGKLDSLHSAFAALTTDPTMPVARKTVLNEISSFGVEANRLLSQIQVLRKEADSHIGQEIETVNNALLRIHELNIEIRSGNQSSRPVGDLLDQRDQALAEISKIMDVKTYPMTDGAVAVVTDTGHQLLDYQPRQLVYSPAAYVGSDTIFNQITINNYDVATKEVAATGLPLDSELTSGSLRGWLDMRNTELPNLASQIGALSAGVAEQLNAVHNENITVPPPAVMTGVNSGVLATDAHGFTGQATFYSFDANNNVLASHTVDFDDLGTNTMADVLAEVNGALGAGTLSLANGVLTMSAQGGAAGIGIGQDAASPSERGGRGFSHFFGMNDLVRADIKTSFATGMSAGDAHGFSGTTTLELMGPNGESPVSMTLDFGAIGGTMADVVNAINSNLGPYATASLDASGALVFSTATGYAGYQINVTENSSLRGATGVSFPEMFGVGLRYPADAGLGFTVNPSIDANPQLLATARIDPAGTPAITVADNRGALAFQELATASIAFPTIGGLTGSTVSLGDYAAQILAKSGLDAARADSLHSDRSALATEFQSRMQEVSGVNMDEELANLIVFQNAYNASARIITTAREMYDILIDLV